jgi:pimeloyl-ACP methyl ester carboxylesterase
MKKSLKLALLAGSLVVGPALINNAIFSRARALGNTLGGEGRFWPWRDGDVFYSHQGVGDKPLLLLHGIYAGASCYEWRKNVPALSEHFSVTAIDWLGFGLSDKPDIRYTDDLYIELLRNLLRDVVAKPCAVVASSLACAYAIEAALAEPELVSDLILVCPTGFDSLTSLEASPASDLRQLICSLPLISTSLYNIITSRASLRAYLQNQTYFDPSYVTDEMIDHYSTAAHQYGSQYAALAFISGTLGHSIAESFPKLRQTNIKIVWGREARMTGLSDAEPFLAANPNAELKVIDKAGIIPHDEQATAFNRLIVESLAGKPHHAGAKEKAKTKASKTEEP